jgi:hypothetical protein
MNPSQGLNLIKDSIVAFARENVKNKKAKSSDPAEGDSQK